MILSNCSNSSGTANTLLGQSLDQDTDGNTIGYCAVASLIMEHGIGGLTKNLAEKSKAVFSEKAFKHIYLEMCRLYVIKYSLHVNT